MSRVEIFWLCVGFTAQAIFSARFIVQWIASERTGKSVMPMAFWYLSLVGSWMLLSYAIYRMDPVIIFGQAFGTAVYMRNIMLVRREQSSLASADRRGEAGSAAPARLRRAG